MAISIQSDEHVKKAISNALKKRGIEVYTVEDEGIKGYDDEDIFEIVVKKKRVLLTNDDDILGIGKETEHPGILFITSQYASVGDIVREVTRLVDQYSEEEFKNTVFYVP